jgi:hydroxysqualene synthase
MPKPVPQPPPVTHDENFPVASWLCPPKLRAPIRAIYHFARTADDLADEGLTTAEQRLGLLHQFKTQFHQYLEPDHPFSDKPINRPDWDRLFASLAHTQREWALPISLLDDLLDAFDQDVRWSAQPRYYANNAELLDYCRRSANPVGRLLLHLYKVQDPQSLSQSDAICSALQLINFWQDLDQDLARGRHYIPDTALQQAKLNRTDLVQQAKLGKATPALCQLIEEQVQLAVRLMHQGAPLARRLPGRMGWELRAVVQGGLQVARRIEQCGFDTLAQRPRLGKVDALVILWRTIWHR